MEEMIGLVSIASEKTLNVGRYGRLLAKFAPKVIESEAENEAALAIVESLVKKGDEGRSGEEEALLELLLRLVEGFESSYYAPPEGTPLGALQYLMEANGLRAIDLAEVLGGRGRVSDILSGRRGISLAQAKRLGERFRLSPAVFI